MSELNCKIVIVGESGVGKTCIISSFLGNEFSEEHKSDYKGNKYCSSS